MSESEKPRIIVDEDWKSQVERERQMAEQSESASQDESATPDESASHDANDSYRLPPATFEVLVSSMATQVLASMGQLADPETGESRMHLEFAKLQIDLLGVLEEKTRGNLTDDEEKMLQEALSQLRMLFVSAQNQEADSGTSDPNGS